MHEPVKSLLCQALSKRLIEVEQLVPTSHDDNNQFSSIPDTSKDYEELLRLMMVKYFPKFQEHTLSIQDMEIYFGLILQLYPQSLGEDLRYFDALNNTYEVIKGVKWSQQVHEKFIVPFLKLYQRVLTTQLKRLEI